MGRCLFREEWGGVHLHCPASGRRQVSQKRTDETEVKEKNVIWIGLGEVLEGIQVEQRVDDGGGCGVQAEGVEWGNRRGLREW